MKIKLIVIGKTKSKFLIEGENEYQKRLKHYCKFSELVIPDVKNAGKISKKELKEKEQELEKRIVGFGFSGKWKKREKDVEIIEKIETFLAPSLEKLVKKQLMKKWKSHRLMDKNLGKGYTEWYYMPPKTMQGIVHAMKKKLYKDDLIINWLNKQGE